MFLLLDKSTVKIKTIHENLDNPFSNKNGQMIRKMLESEKVLFNSDSGIKMTMIVLVKLFESIRITKSRQIKEVSRLLSINDYAIKHLFLDASNIDLISKTTDQSKENLTWNFAEIVNIIEPNSKFVKYSLIRQLIVSPNDPNLLYHLAYYYFSSKSYEKASSIVEKTLNLPNFVRNNLTKSVMLAMVKIKMILEMNGNIQEAIEYAIFALEKSKEQIEDTKLTARCYFNLSECYLAKANQQPLFENRMDNLNKAIEFIKSAIDYDFANDRYKIAFAKLSYLIGKLEEAKQLLGEVDNYSSDKTLLMSLILMAKHNFKEAMELTKEYFTQNRKSYENY